MEDNRDNKDNETLADIEREIRAAAAGRDEVENVLFPKHWLTDWADRIRAATFRERVEVAMTASATAANLTDEWRRELANDRQMAGKCGNAAEMREALEMCVKYMCKYCQETDPDRPCKEGCETYWTAKVALAAPARNCDRFRTSEEAWAAFRPQYEKGHGARPDCEEFGTWLFSTEGGAE